MGEMFMLRNGFYWRNREMRQHVRVVDGEVAPTIVLENATYLNAYTKQWVESNIWMYEDRIVYVGEQMPANLHDTEIVDCTGKYVVSGYIEPHAHPFQLYNPEQLAWHAAKTGTTTLINDNLLWLFMLNKKKAFSILEEFSKHPVSMYWWARFDPQTELQGEHGLFQTEDVLSWVKHPAVVQGGELTSWPDLLAGDDILLYWIQETKNQRKPVEGHFPGASERTLTKMKLLGVNADHESISGEEILRRLRLGYHVGLRYSSIRPDLPNLIKEMLAAGLTSFENLTFTTDGATPAFYETGLINQCIDIAIKKGIPIEEAYLMGSFYAAKHLRMEEQLGSITPGRFAHINILTEKDNPHPESVLSKGKWIVKHGEQQKMQAQIPWSKYHIKPLDLDWEISYKELQFSVPIGLEMVNDVIMTPYPIEVDITVEELPAETTDSFLILLDRHGKWRVNTTLRGFTNELGAIASSYSVSGDFVFIGKRKSDLLLAGKRVKELGGGIVIAHHGEILLEIPLQLGGMMYAGAMDELIKQEKELKQILQSFGYPFSDPVYSIFFLSSTHLPYVRITPQGIIDVKQKELLFPATMC